MASDLRGALLKKAEVQSARPEDVEFRLRARTMRLLAPLLGVEPEALVARIALESDEAILATLPEPATSWYAEARTEAHRQLIDEWSDPTAY